MPKNFEITVCIPAHVARMANGMLDRCPYAILAGYPKGRSLP